MAARQYFPDSTWLPPPADAFRKALPFANEAVKRAPRGRPTRCFMRSKLYCWLLEATADPAWRDSALADLRSASAMAGGRADIWAQARRSGELAPGCGPRRASRRSRARRRITCTPMPRSAATGGRIAELVLGEFDQARESCRSGARVFPGRPYFIACEAEVLGCLSSDPARRTPGAGAGRFTGRARRGRAVADHARRPAAAVRWRSWRGPACSDSAGRVYDRVVGGWHGAVDPEPAARCGLCAAGAGGPGQRTGHHGPGRPAGPGVGARHGAQPWYQALRRQPGFPAAMKGISPTERPPLTIAIRPSPAVPSVALECGYPST